MDDPFFQVGPRLGNQYDGDAVLRAHLTRVLPPDMLAELGPKLAELGEAAAGPMLDLADAAEDSPPLHIPFDPWGRRVDEVRTHPAWTELGRIAARTGLTAIPHEQRWGEHGRTVQMALAYLYAPSAATYLCPVAMTDAAARTLVEHGDPAVCGPVVERLTTRDPERIWWSGQWMTEREGGSDVGRTATVARRDGEQWRLYGTKWFTSAVTADVALALARPEGAGQGSRGLALFMAELHGPGGEWNNLRVNRLKDKLGTRALPTAELELEGTAAVPVGSVEKSGVAKIATMLNLTRLHNSVAAVSGMRRGLALALSYAGEREAFGARLVDLPLHAETLAEVATEVEGGFALTFRVAQLCGKVEAGTADADEWALWRILTPLAKLFTGKQAVAVASEVVECFAGAGYIEDTGIPRLLRDAQVLPLWEGTTNVLSLDVLRAMARDDAAKPLLVEVGDRVRRARDLAPLADAATVVDAAGVVVSERLAALPAESDAVVQAGARTLALRMASVEIGALLLEAATWALQNDPASASRAVTAARRWALRLRGPTFPGPQDLSDCTTLLT